MEYRSASTSVNPRPWLQSQTTRSKHTTSFLQHLKYVTIQFHEYNCKRNSESSKISKSKSRHTYVYLPNINLFTDNTEWIKKCTQFLCGVGPIFRGSLNTIVGIFNEQIYILKTPTPFGITGGLIIVSQLRAYSVVCVFLIEKKRSS